MIKQDRRFRKMVLLYFYGELSASEKRIFQDHLGDCLYCQRELRRLEKLGSVVSKAPEVVPSKILMERASMRVMEEIRAESSVKGFSLLRDGLENLVESFQMYFSRPRYQLIAVSVVFLVGMIVGKMWMSSDLINDPEALANFAENFVKMSPTEETRIQRALANYLMQSGDIEVADLFQEEKVENGADVVEVNFTVGKNFALEGGLDDPTIRNVLMYSALHDENVNRRMRALRLLSRSVPSKEIELTLVSVLLRDSEYEVRLHALRTLVKMKYVEDVVYACKKVILYDSNADVRMEALEYLYEVGDKTIIPIIAVVSTKDKNDSIRARAEEVLRELNSKYRED